MQTLPTALADLVSQVVTPFFFMAAMAPMEDPGQFEPHVILTTTDNVAACMEMLVEEKTHWDERMAEWPAEDREWAESEDLYQVFCMEPTMSPLLLRGGTFCWWDAHPEAACRKEGNV